MTDKQIEWTDLRLDPSLLDLITKKGFLKPTPVQGAAIPHVLDGLDLIVSAQTGTGKTAAFSFPMIQRMLGRGGTMGLVLAPSREIALQTQQVMEDFGKPLGVNSAALIGGVDIRYDNEALKSHPQVLIATPGRLCDHLERGNLWLEYLEMVVLDEADMMLDMGFADQLSRILNATSPSRQTLLFSATVPKPVEKLAQKILHEPKRIQLGKPVSTAKTVEQSFIFLPEERKFNELLKLLDREKGTMFVFVSSKLGADKLWRSLHSRGFYEATRLHSDMRQQDREQAVEDFKAGKFRVIIATDVGGRGLHVDNVAHVVNYDMPREATDYVHRIGRTGRAESTGKATSFVTRRDKATIYRIEDTLGLRIPMPN